MMPILVFKVMVVSAVYLQRLILNQFGVEFNIATIRLTRRKLGWVQSGPKYCQLIRIPNQIARLAFAQDCLLQKEQFDNVIFTDEFSILLDKHGKLCFRKKGTLPNLKPTVKHPYKVHVWAGISKRGPTNIAIFMRITRKKF
ncbi:uncharacterized protein LOC130625687 [Hydractinia symbiolongicarpus]|uniref:uncharacterized protein LOC130625687 n=1 Tax=Hydractinia symbiolongicarpus TaxID=13093 RepID=UPI00254A2F45|nr:uncharacterized protein LOC130625687 [Hydractinia symbiolongicarpus]